MKKWVKIIIIIVIIIVVIATVTGTIILINKKSSKNKEGEVKGKASDELKYLDTTIVSMINSLNNLYETDMAKVKISIKGSEDATSSGGESSNSSSKKTEKSENSGTSASGQSSENQSEEGSGSESELQTYTVQNSSIILRDKTKIDWSRLENEAEDLYGTWVTATLDLNNLNVSNDDILAYNTNLDKLLVSIKEQNKINSGICLANMYSLIPKYMEEISESKGNTNIQKIKSNIIFAYSIVNSGSWDNVVSKLGEAENILKDMINSSTKQTDIKQVSLNKSYVLLKELIKSGNEKNEDLFYLKYINLINELERV